MPEQVIKISGELGYAKVLAKKAEQLRLTMRDVADRAGFTYEHVRKVFNGGSFPSRLMLQELCRILGLPFKELEQMVVADRIRTKYSRQLNVFTPDTELMLSWGELTEDQRSAVQMLISGYQRQNSLRKAG